MNNLEQLIQIEKKDMKQFIVYLYKFIGYLNTALPQFYVKRLKPFKNVTDKFENVDELEDLQQSNIYNYIMEYANMALPISKYLLKTDINVFELETYETIENAKNPAIYLIGSQLDFVRLWEDNEIMTTDIKKKTIVFLSVLYKQAVNIMDTNAKILNEMSGLEFKEVLEQGRDEMRKMITQALGEGTQDTDNASKFFDSIINVIENNKINPAQFLTDVFKGNISPELNNLFQSFEDEIKQCGVSVENIIETTSKILKSTGNNEIDASLQSMLDMIKKQQNFNDNTMHANEDSMLTNDESMLTNEESMTDEKKQTLLMNNSELQNFLGNPLFQNLIRNPELLDPKLKDLINNMKNK